MKRPRVIPELPLQQQIADALTIEIAPPGKLSPKLVVWFSVDHANFAGTAPGARMARGIIAGLPDVWFLFGGGCYLIELKNTAGVLSEAQREVLIVARLAGVSVAVCQTLEEVLTCLDAWEIPRARKLQLSRIL